MKCGEGRLDPHPISTLCLSMYLWNSPDLSLSLSMTESLHLPCLWVSPLIKSIINTLGVWQSWLRGEDQRWSTGCLPKHRENYSHPSVSTGFPSGSAVKNPPAILETEKMLVRSLGREVLVEEGMAADSSILAWRIPLIEEPGGLQSMGSWRVGRDWNYWAWIWVQYPQDGVGVLSSRTPLGYQNGEC